MDYFYILLIDFLHTSNSILSSTIPDISVWKEEEIKAFL